MEPRGPEPKKGGGQSDRPGSEESKSAFGEPASSSQSAAGEPANSSQSAAGEPSGGDPPGGEPRGGEAPGSTAGDAAESDLQSPVQEDRRAASPLPEPHLDLL